MTAAVRRKLPCGRHHEDDVAGMRGRARRRKNTIRLTFSIYEGEVRSERRGGSAALSTRCCVPRARRSYRAVGTAREKSMAFDFDGRLLTTVASDAGATSSGIATILVSVSLALFCVPFTHSSGSSRFGSARVRLAWLGTAWLGLACPTTRSVRSSTRFERARTITLGVTRLSTSARANHGRLRRAARWRLRRL